MLLLVGNQSDPTLQYFADFLRSRGGRHDQLFLDAPFEDGKLLYEMSTRGLRVQRKAAWIDFSDYSGIYNRLYIPPSVDSVTACAGYRLMSAAAGYLEVSDQTIVNRPSAGALNASKLAQLVDLRACGFKIPETHVFGAVEEAVAKVSPDGNWIHKGCSSIRTIAAVLDQDLFAVIDRLDNCPSLFQRRIRGFDVRAHIVGSQSIACRLTTEAADYRYPGGAEVAIEPIALPEHVELACLEYCRRQRLVFAGVDFKVCAETGDYYVLEVNPMPGFEFFDRRLDQRILIALEAALSAGHPLHEDVSGPPQGGMIEPDRIPKVR